MERSHAPWSSWLTSWTSPCPERMESSLMDGHMTAVPPKHSVRSLPKTSGLFDREITGDFLKEFSSVTTEHKGSTSDQSQTIVAGAGDLDSLSDHIQSDLIDLFGDDGDFLLSSMEKFEETGDGCYDDLLSFQDGSLDMEGEIDLEAFTDLSAAILGVDVNAPTNKEETINEVITSEVIPEFQQPMTSAVLNLPAPTTQPTVAKKGKLALKRKLKQQEKDTAATTIKKSKRQEKEAKIKQVVVAQPMIVVNPDHDDYTLKISKKVDHYTFTVKKPKASTSSFDDYVSESESVADSIASSSTFDHPSISGATTAVPAELKYKVRRHKNNIASRRSRQTRKQKFNDMEDKTDILEKENEAMREKIILMEELAKSLKQHLVSRMAGK